MNSNIPNMNSNLNININPSLNKQMYQKQNKFTMNDQEVYMIKESNIKRIHDILKNSYTAKANEDCNVILILF
jgi:hypothetical protein